MTPDNRGDVPYCDRYATVHRGFAAIAFAVATIGGAVVAHADECDGIGESLELTVADVLDESVDVFKSPYGSGEGKSLKKGAISGAAVTCEADNGMLHVAKGNVKGWVYPHTVETSAEVTLRSRCLNTASAQKVGATRGVGEDCN